MWFVFYLVTPAGLEDKCTGGQLIQRLDPGDLWMLSPILWMLSQILNSCQYDADFCFSYGSNLSHRAFRGDNLSLPDWMLWPCKWCHGAICASDWLPKPAVTQGKEGRMLWLDLNCSPNTLHRLAWRRDYSEHNHAVSTHNTVKINYTLKPKKLR